MSFFGDLCSLPYGDVRVPASMNLCTFAKITSLLYLLEFCLICIVSDCHKSLISFHDASKPPIAIHVLCIHIHSFLKVFRKVEDDLTCYLVRLHYIIVGKIIRSQLLILISLPSFLILYSNKRERMQTDRNK